MQEVQEEEIEKILEKQSKENININKEFIEKYIEIFISQRNYDEGPGKPSKYAVNFLNLVGNCTFEENEKRAFKATFTFELFKCLQDLNHIKIEKLNLIKTEKGNIYHKRIKETSRYLTSDEKEKILDALKSSGELKYNKIRKILNLSKEYIFNMLTYDFSNLKDIDDLNKISDIIDENEKEAKTKLKEFISYNKIRKVLNKYKKDYIVNLDVDTIDYIATTLSVYKTDVKRIEHLNTLVEKGKLESGAIDYLLSLSFSEVGSLSIKAMRKIIPYLADGLTYDKAVVKVYGEFRGKLNLSKKKKLSILDLEETTNPVVRRGIGQTIKVLNNIINKYGQPERVNIELARDISRNFNERKKMAKAMEENLAINENIKKEIESTFNKNKVTGQDILKYRLYKEQNGICPYSGKMIDASQIFTELVDIDHIIPYSKSYDDSYSNKVLVLASKNREKTNRLPLEYIREKNQNEDEFIARIEDMYKGGKLASKRKKLLKEEYTEEDEKEWKSRNLKDTQYISRVILNYIRNNLEFEKNENIPEERQVNAVKGGITSQIRKRLGLSKIREDGDKHHAMDAAIIAITTDSMIQNITKFCKRQEDRYSNRKNTKEEFNEKFPEPYKNFVDELNARMKDTDEEVQKSLRRLNLITYINPENEKAIFVSRMPKRKVKGALHKDTFGSIGKNGEIVEKKKLTELKLTKDNEIDGYYNKEDDKLLYNALRERLIKYNGNAKEAFKETFFKPKSDGTQGPIVKKVKISRKGTSNVSIDKIHAVADNDKMVRIDVFYVENDGYYLIPIYTIDTIKKELPNKACVAHKDISQWKEMKEEDFIFSLYPNDLISITSKNSISMENDNKEKKEDIKVFDKNTEILLYYNSTNISTGVIKGYTNDGKYTTERGIKTLLQIKKYNVDVLGNYSEVKIPEKRLRFNIK